MSKQNEHHDTYTIPPNFIEGGTLFGGMFKIRNVIEAGIIAFAVGMPVFSIDISLTARIIILCLTALPLGLFALMGVNGEPLSSYIIAFFKWLGNRRVIGKVEPKKKKAKKEKKPEPPKPVKEAAENESMLSEIVGVIRKRSAIRKRKNSQRRKSRKRHLAERQWNHRSSILLRNTCQSKRLITASSTPRITVISRLLRLFPSTFCCEVPESNAALFIRSSVILKSVL